VDELYILCNRHTHPILGFGMIYGGREAKYEKSILWMQMIAEAA
jgi:hypothetical protein